MRASSCSPQRSNANVTIADLQTDIAAFSTKVFFKVGCSEEVSAIHKRMTDIQHSVEFNLSRIIMLEKNIPKTCSELQDEVKKKKNWELRRM